MLCFKKKDVVYYIEGRCVFKKICCVLKKDVMYEIKSCCVLN